MLTDFMSQINDEQVPGSFRDPSGFLFYRDGVLYRQINSSYRSEYFRLNDSGLYNALVEKGMLVASEETSEACTTKDGFLVIKPEIIPFISYPYEWCFSQLKDAALLTLDIQLEALSKGMCLKDASAYNIQFNSLGPIFIDSLSFDIYEEGKPWAAYKQFCQHFLAPLALMSYKDVRLNKLFVNFIDGIPLDLASCLLPQKTKLSPSLGLHIHLHAKQQIKHRNNTLDKNKLRNSMSMHSMLAILDSLKGAINKLHWSSRSTEWNDYYASNNNYSFNGMQHKEKIVSNFIMELKPGLVWDLGANDGRFSRIVREYAQYVVSWDVDYACVENNYLFGKKQNEVSILPLVVDLFNPSPSIGWGNSERSSFMDRRGCDVLLALGLVHHLAITNNLPLERIAQLFSQLGRYLIIEFVPKEDSQVIKLLKNRFDLFPNYSIEAFEAAFSQFFLIECIQPVKETMRIVYLLKAKQT